MASLKTQLLLARIAEITQQEKEKISKVEISQKINEIKYLAAQKKVPRLTLRKEILHLEHQMQNIFQLEQAFFKRKEKESTKVAALKKQVALLKKRLAASENKNLHKKVEKLSHLLGEYLAKKETKDDIKLRKRVMAELNIPTKEKHKTSTTGEKKMRKSSSVDESCSRLQSLFHRLEALKNELLINKKLEEKNPEKVRIIEEQIELLEKKVYAYYQQHPELGTCPVSEEIKHNLLFDPDSSLSEKSNLELEKELPLPPPPKMLKTG